MEFGIQIHMFWINGLITEEHIYDKHEFYNDFLYQEDQKKKYDYIFGHGVIDEIMSTGKKEKESSKKIKYQKNWCIQNANKCKCV